MTTPRPTHHHTLTCLRTVLFSDRHDQQITIRDHLAALADTPAPAGPTGNLRGCRQLVRQLITGLGGSSRALAADHHRLAAVFDWTAVSAPRLLPTLGGHFTAVALACMGDGESGHPRSCPSELDDATTPAVPLLTELAHSTRGPDHRTHALWQPESRTFRLHTTGPGAIKITAHTLDPAIPTTAVVTAHLIVDGRDEGVWPFLAGLRTGDGLAYGTHITQITDTTTGVPLDYAMVRFDGLDLPEQAWLHTNHAALRPNGSLPAAGDLGQRHDHTRAALQSARLCLAGAAVAVSRAAVAITTHYAARRLTAGEVPMLRRDAVQRELISATAAAYAMTTLARTIGDLFAATTPARVDPTLAAAVATPLFTRTAQQIIETCRQRCGATGLLRHNYLSDYLACVAAITATADDGQTPQIAAGRHLRRLGTPPPLPIDTSGEPRWWHRMLAERVQTLLDPTAVRPGNGLGADESRIKIADAVAEHLAAQSLTAAAHQVSDTATRSMVVGLADIYALHRVRADAGWFTAYGQLTPRRSADLFVELGRRYDQLAPHLPALTEAFSVPPIPAPVYSPDYVTAYLDLAGWRHQFRPAPDRTAP